MNLNQNTNILVVDDCKDNILLMELLLKSEGYQVRSAATGMKGIAEIARKTPDLIILDLMMPDISGLEVIKYLKNRCRIGNVPIIMLTANSCLRHEDVRDVDALCYKPFNIDRLLAKIRSVLVFPVAV